MSTLTSSMRDAMEWLAKHNGDGSWGDVGHTFIAAGERAPFTRTTFNKLAALGFVEFYQDKKRMRLVRMPDPKPIKVRGRGTVGGWREV